MLRAGDDDHNGTEDRRPVQRPFALLPALLLAAAITTVTLLARWSSAELGKRGAVIVAGLAGFADVHGPALAVATLAHGGALDESTALAAVGAALATNTLTKVVLATAGGGQRLAVEFGALLLAPAAAVATTIATAVATA